jgi:uncharacterized protein YgiB involved in biofilm formation
MTRRNKKKTKILELIQIHRAKVYWGLAISGVMAFIIYSINADMTEEEVNEQINTLFYRNVAQCETDIKTQQDEYVISLAKYRAGEIAEEPTPPPMQTRDCAPQMLAAEQEHIKTAPVYGSIADCQVEGVQCEMIPAGEQTTGYRPVYGGTYINPYDNPFVYINYAGNQHRVYESRTVYQSITPGNIVTPYGREIAQSSTGRVMAPRHTSFVAPSRPTGTSASGTIRGRSSQGFGSSFKSTGSGGK